MSDLLVEAQVTCPWCWEQVPMLLDLSAGDQAYVEDCPVCCNPMDVVFSAADGILLDVEARRAQ